MRVARHLALVALSATVPACFSPTAPEGLECAGTEEPACPGGMSCEGDFKCRLDSFAQDDDATLIAESFHGPRLLVAPGGDVFVVGRDATTLQAWRLTEDDQTLVREVEMGINADPLSATFSDELNEIAVLYRGEADSLWLARIGIAATASPENVPLDLAEPGRVERSTVRAAYYPVEGVTHLGTVWRTLDQRKWFCLFDLGGDKADDCILVELQPDQKSDLNTNGIIFDRDRVMIVASPLGLGEAVLYPVVFSGADPVSCAPGADRKGLATDMLHTSVLAVDDGYVLAGLVDGARALKYLPPEGDPKPFEIDPRTSPLTPNGRSPAIAWNGSILAVAWRLKRSDGVIDVYVRYFPLAPSSTTDEAFTPVCDAQRVTTAANHSAYDRPQIVWSESAGKFVLLWQDSRGSENDGFGDDEDTYVKLLDPSDCP